MPRRRLRARLGAAGAGRTGWLLAFQRGIVIGLAVFALQRAWVATGRSGDFRLYVWTGEAALARGDLYHGCPWGACTWPPVFSLGCIPLALLNRWSDVGARAAWIVLNAAALGAVMVWLARWSGGGRLAWWPRAGMLSPASPECLIPLLIAGRFLLVNLEFLQINLLILFLEVAGLWWIARGRDLPGGVLIGLAGALKVLPCLLVPWLFWRGRRRAAVAAAVSGGIWTLVPAWHFGWNAFMTLLLDWPRAVRGDWGVNGPNQSVYATFDRVIGHGVTPLNAGMFSWDYVAPSGDPVVGWLAAGAAMVAITWAVVRWRHPLRLSTTAGLAEAGAVLTASVVFAPLAWVHYFVVLLVPAAAAMAALRSGAMPSHDRRVVGTWLAASTAAVWLTSRAFAGPRLAKVALSLSSVTLAALLLMALGGWLARRARA